MDTFLGFPTWLIIGICVLVPVVVCLIIVPLVISGKYKTQAEDDSVIGPSAAFLGTAFTLLLAFVIVNVWSAESAREEALFREFSQVEDIMLEVSVIDPAMEKEFHDSLQTYVNSLIAKEIEVSPPIGGDDETNNAFQDFLKVVDKSQVELSADKTKATEANGLFTEVQQLISERQTRVNSGGAHLDVIFVAIMALLGLMTVILVSLLPATSSKKSKWVQSLSVAITTGLIMSMVFYISSVGYSHRAEQGQIERILELFNR